MKQKLSLIAEHPIPSCILVFPTIILYGYDPRRLRPNSMKPVVCVCISCFTARIKGYCSAVNQPSCRLCSNRRNANTNLIVRGEKIKKHWETNPHPRLGTSHSTEARKLISEKNKLWERTPAYRQTMRKLYTGSGNPFYNKKHSDKSLKLMSDSHKITVRRGKDSNFYGRIYHGKGTARGRFGFGVAMKLPLSVT